MPDTRRQIGGVSTRDSGFGWLSRRQILDARTPRGFIDGFQITIQDTNDLSISTGLCRDSTDSIGMELTSTLVKQMDPTDGWALGTNAGGFPDALTQTVSTWYHVYIIGDGVSFDAGVDSSTTAANLLSDTPSWTFYRRIASILMSSGDADAPKPYIQSRDYFYWVDSVLDVDDPTSGTTATDISLTVPPDVRVLAILNGCYQSAVNDPGIYIAPTDVTGAAPGNDITGGNSAPLTSLPQLGTGSDFIGAQLVVLTDTSQQIQYHAESNSDLAIATLGWIDSRGKT